jgi:hypothetical protein
LQNMGRWWALSLDDTVAILTARVNNERGRCGTDNEIGARKRRAIMMVRLRNGEASASNGAF